MNEKSMRDSKEYGLVEEVKEEAVRRKANSVSES
jgi:hypothetical protein